MISRKQQDRLILMGKKMILNLLKNSGGKSIAWLTSQWGAYSCYFKLTESFGVKVYLNGHNNIDGYYQKFRRQVAAYKVGLAPYCFGMFKVRYKGATYFCNITEHVTIHREVAQTRFTSSDMKKIPQIKHMRRKFEKMFDDFDFQDCHNANVAVRSPFKRKNELLCIDFDL